MLRVGLVGLILLHGAIHGLGFVKAFGLANVEQLEPIGHTAGIAWLVTGLGFIASAIVLLVAPRHWGWVALPALVASAFLVLTWWSDARAGLVVNVILLVPVALSLADFRSTSLRSEYDRRVAETLDVRGDAPLVTDADLEALPAPIQKYLRRAGVVGKPRVRHVSARWRAELRNGRDDGWMTGEAEQHDFFDVPARLFIMNASRQGVPFEALHVYTGSSAWMRVRVASVFPVFDATGPQMDQSETVTLFNDLCLLAPAALIEADVQWELIDDRRVRAAYTNAGHTISAVLVFDEHGDLVDFVSHDRFESADGKSFRARTWRTPARAHRELAGVRVVSDADAIWEAPDGDWTYARFTLEDLHYGGRTRSEEPR